LKKLALIDALTKVVLSYEKIMQKGEVLMSNPYIEPLLEAFIFETSQLLEQLEQLILTCEKSGCYSTDNINEIFRIMHTVKGSSAMMVYNNISSLAHAVEDLFFYIREKRITDFNCSNLSDLVLGCVDFIKVELEKIKAKDVADGDSSIQIESILAY
jgi:two-component system chemotaxis sensor kinase CheA